MRELKRTVETYIVNSEQDALDFIQEIKDSQSEDGYLLTKCESAYKTRKQKGEIVDEWYEVKFQKDYIEVSK